MGGDNDDVLKKCVKYKAHTRRDKTTTYDNTKYVRCYHNIIYTINVPWSEQNSYHSAGKTVGSPRFVSLLNITIIIIYFHVALSGIVFHC